MRARRPHWSRRDGGDLTIWECETTDAARLTALTDATARHDRLGVVSGSSLEVEERVARQAAADAARERLDGLAEEYADHLELVDSLRTELDHEAPHVAEEKDGDDLDAAARERLEHQEIRLAVVTAQREAVIRLRDDGVIGDDALRIIERDLDLEAVRAGA